MFTGIVEGKGKVLKIEYRGDTRKLSLEFPPHLTDVQLGDSISINGVCLTVTERHGLISKFDLSDETIKRSALGEIKEGSWVNLECALKLNGRLGGHFVTGHIDGIGIITEKRKERDFYRLKVRLPEHFARYVVPKGSIAIDGISLTVNECRSNEIQLTLIPYTLEKTVMMDKRVGDHVNLETDILGKYVEKLLKGEKLSEGLSLSFLKEHGMTGGNEGTDG
ncbi:MAG: riboflavin synthase [Deltaproteobacteria bacterium]|nr:riboflavin synthase [Deltaproteobacteria bacterium]